jgi:hypothetical protein
MFDDFSGETWAHQRETEESSLVGLEKPLPTYAAFRTNIKKTFG